MVSLLTIPDDVLVLICSTLDVPNLLSLRQSCHRMWEVSSLWAVWYNAYVFNILRNGYPFPEEYLHVVTTSELQCHVCRAYRLGRKWLSEVCKASNVTTFEAAPTTALSYVHFVPGRGGKYLLTVSKGIWSVLSLWRIDDAPVVCAEWSPKGAIYVGIALNEDASSDGMLAISIMTDDRHTTEILALKLEHMDSTSEFQSISTIDTTFQPIVMRGDILVLSDDTDQTVIYNWRTGTRSVLQGRQEDEVPKYNPCMQVVFAFKSILVVRARSLHLFLEPIPKLSETPPRYQPLIRYSFGWADSISVTPHPHVESLCSMSILVRSESDDPWSSDSQTLDLYTLDVNPAFISSLSSQDSGKSYHTLDDTLLPYIFPPKLRAQAETSRGPLRCPTSFLGTCGTAVWIRPRNHAATGLLSSDVLQQAVLPSSSSAHETLVGALFPGILCHSSCGLDPRPVQATALIHNELNNWTAMDYDETLGRIVLGSSFGSVTIVEL